MIKKSILAAAVATIMLVPGFSTVASAADVSIGLVDTNVIIAKSALYSALRKAQADLDGMSKNFQKDYMDRMAKLQKAKTKEEFEKLQKQYEGELRQKQSQAMASLQSKQKSLEALKDSLRKKVEVAIKDIAKQKKLTFVVDKQAMYYGGTDITNDVLNRIK
jgi:Skp family chaperone for outer membrane proteins